MALHNRWIVLDRTINLSDDEPVDQSQEYLQLSEGEEDEVEETRKVEMEQKGKEGKI